MKSVERSQRFCAVQIVEGVLEEERVVADGRRREARSSGQRDSIGVGRGVNDNRRPAQFGMEGYVNRDAERFGALLGSSVGELLTATVY